MMQWDEFLGRLRRDYPKLKFRLGKKFKFRSPRTIYYETPLNMSSETKVEFEQKNKIGSFPPDDGLKMVSTMVDVEQNWYFLQLLHEVGHALLGHDDYKTDPERVRMERAAWDKARELCDKYGVDYDEEFVETALDSYRDWLHQRSICKGCGQTRYQSKDGIYHCPFCDTFRLNGVRD